MQAMQAIEAMFAHATQQMGGGVEKGMKARGAGILPPAGPPVSPLVFPLATPVAANPPPPNNRIFPGGFHCLALLGPACSRGRSPKVICLVALVSSFRTCRTFEVLYHVVSHTTYSGRLIPPAYQELRLFA